MKTLPLAETFTISDAAKSSGLGTETVRFYERQGLLPEPPRTASGYRQYTTDDVRRLSFIRRAKTLGFTLKEIGELLGLTEQRAASAGEVKELATAKLERVREQIRDLQKIEKALHGLVKECSGVGPASRCPILNAITFESIGNAPARRKSANCH
ncbi:MAG: heavy metal-responsive transcriptional regulator [Chthoniobacteraceae bacterium]